MRFNWKSTQHYGDFSNMTGKSFFLYYWLNGQTLVGPHTDNADYPEVKPETWEDFLSKREMKILAHTYFSLAK